jgi:voltage-gated potassium channel
MNRQQRFLEFFIQFVIFYSLGTHFLEIELGEAENPTPFFLWSERVVAAIFTVEYFVRWIGSRTWTYPFRLMAILDLLAVLPFYLTFIVDMRALRLLRTLRMLRLFKLSRHGSALKNIVNAFNRIRYEFSIVGFAVFVIGWCCAVAIYELERESQPAIFGKLSDAVWFVLTTLTTVGYGDKVPVTAGGKVVAALTMIAGLGLFGTFVSLVGSAFLEEIRKGNPFASDQIREKDRGPVQKEFDPHEVLKWIDQGCPDRGIEFKPDPVSLLREACLVLVRMEVNSGGLKELESPK